MDKKQSYTHEKSQKIKKKLYWKGLERLQIELLKLQRWIKSKGPRVVAPGVSSGRQKSQWYFQPYVRPLFKDQTLIPGCYE